LNIEYLILYFGFAVLLAAAVSVGVVWRAHRITSPDLCDLITIRYDDGFDRIVPIPPIGVLDPFSIKFAIVALDMSELMSLQD